MSESFLGKVAEAEMTMELYSVALVAAFTGVIWIPVILNRLVDMGVWSALKNPQPDTHPKAAWAFRLQNAHRNAIENLVVFAPLAIVIDLADLGSELTAVACAVFVIARILHAVIYAFGIPLLRTLAFAAGFVCQCLLALRIFGLV